MKIIKIAAMLATATLAGCGTYNSWTPRETSYEPAERSCASGYYNCELRTSGEAGRRGPGRR
jgi:hypothetical protein